MLYNIRCYKNTGFNSIDIPENAQVLEDAEYIDFDNVDVVQNIGLTEVNLNATFDEIKNIDYINIGGVFYTLTTAPIMLNSNTAKLNITEDFITSLGGIKSEDFIDATINFGCPSSNDIFHNIKPENRWTPSQPLGIVYRKLTEDTGDNFNFVESTLSIPYSNEISTCSVYEGDTSEGGIVSVAVPDVEGVKEETKYGFYFKGELKTTKSPNTCLYDTSDIDYTLNQGISGVRKLGLSDAILAQYEIPAYYVEPYAEGDFTIETPNITGGNTGYIGKRINKITPTIRGILAGDRDSKFEFTYRGGDGTGYIPKNNFVYNGSFNAYTLYSMSSGESIEANPEDLYKKDTDNPMYTPEYVITADLRSTGGPIGYPAVYKGELNKLMFNNIKGLPWKSAQDVFYGAEGMTLYNYNFRTNREIQSVGHTMNLVNQGVNGLNSLIGGIGGGAQNQLNQMMSPTGNSQVYYGNAVPYLSAVSNAGLVSTGINLVQGATNVLFNQYVYNRQRSQAAINNYYDNVVVAPTLHFPRNPSIRDFVGNGFFISRLYLQDEDLKSFDNFITMNGEPLGKSIFDDNYFNNRQYFHYISLSNVSLKKTNCSMLEREGLMSQLLNCRLWKILPKNYNITLGNPIIV